MLMATIITPLGAFGQAPSVKVDKDGYVVDQHSVKPIPYRPISLPIYLGRPVLPTERFEWSVTREMLTPAEFERRINELEKSANAQGDSLTDRPDAISTQEELAEKRKAQLNADPRFVQMHSRQQDLLTPPTSVSQKFVMDNPSVNGGGYTSMSEKRVERVYKASYEKGDVNNAALKAYATLTFRASQSRAELLANVTAVGYLKGKRIPMAELNYTSKAPAKGAGTSTGTLKVAGYEVWSHKKSGNFAEVTLVKKEWPLWTPDATKVKIKTSAWGIPISVRAGIEGNVGVELKASIRALGAGLGAIPYAEAHAYAEVGVDLIIIEFGIGGELSIVKYQIPIWGYCEARISHGRWALKATVDVSNTLTAGEGRIYAYVKILGFKKKKTLVSWDALYQTSGTLWKEEYWQFI